MRSTPGLLTCGKASTLKGSPTVAVREAIFEVGRPRRGRYHAALLHPGVLAALVPPAADRRRFQRLAPAADRRRFQRLAPASELAKHN